VYKNKATYDKEKYGNNEDDKDNKNENKKRYLMDVYDSIGLLGSKEDVLIVVVPSSTDPFFKVSLLKSQVQQESSGGLNSIIFLKKVLKNPGQTICQNILCHLESSHICCQPNKVCSTTTSHR
jgi:hypothetical protein